MASNISSQALKMLKDSRAASGSAVASLGRTKQVFKMRSLVFLHHFLPASPVPDFSSAFKLQVGRAWVSVSISRHVDQRSSRCLSVRGQSVSAKQIAACLCVSRRCRTSESGVEEKTFAEHDLICGLHLTLSSSGSTACMLMKLSSGPFLHPDSTRFPLQQRRESCHFFWNPLYWFALEIGVQLVHRHLRRLFSLLSQCVQVEISVLFIECVGNFKNSKVESDLRNWFPAAWVLQEATAERKECKGMLTHKRALRVRPIICFAVAPPCQQARAVKGANATNPVSCSLSARQDATGFADHHTDVP
ncbi:hypothetical protein JOL62DRAFT_278923 [Phyllosticta paracitricarpa]|uniref:Uncharacterized protein n=1 Tax=Phyllosticta paracitricarpa TaxID=2016321 RepID=A0ABR1MW30_9PEZI